MPLPKPNTGEKKDDFVNRCMGDQAMNTEYPESDQRYAVCNDIWNKRELEAITYILEHREIKEDIQATDKIQEIQIFPRGKIYVEKYDKTIDFNINFFTDMIKAFNEPALSKPFVDENHEFRNSLADIVGLEAKEAGMFARIKLNADGIDAIKNNKYKYVSPAFWDVTDNTGKIHKNALRAVTLTNIPALQGTLPTLQEQIKLSGEITNVMLLEFKQPQKKTQGVKMNLIANHFGLNAEASEKAILEAAVEQKKTLEAERDQARTELEAEKKKKEIAVKELKDAKEKLDKIEMDANTAEKEAYFKKADEEGRVELNEIEKWKAQWDKDKEFVKDILDSREIKKQGQKSANNPDGITKLETEDREIMISAGFDPDKPEDVKKYQAYVLEQEVK